MEIVRFGLCRDQKVPFKFEKYKSERPTLHLSGPLVIFSVYVFCILCLFFLFCWLLARSLLTPIGVLISASLIRTGLNKTMMVGWIQSLVCQKTASSRGNDDEQIVKR